MSVPAVGELTRWDPFFLQRIARLVEAEQDLAPRVFSCPEAL
ncbi:MAG: hypothetical protein NZ869_10900 [Thermoanaerobaculum sp.]|nr:hypothetical protein [Thermoanaerobaculum sp.]MDW7967523.1 hypothetical protein [Thermoanaerobaculum sp.]